MQQDLVHSIVARDAEMCTQAWRWRNGVQVIGVPPRNAQGRLFDTASPYLTIDEAAHYLRTSTKTLRRAVLNGVLPERRVGGSRSSLRFIREDLDAYLRRGVGETPRKQAPPALSPAAQRLVGLTQDN